jgi:hypothetical protein
MDNAHKLKEEIEDAIEAWKTEADQVNGGEPVDKEGMIAQEDEIRHRHRKDARDYLDRIERVIANEDGLSQEEKEDLFDEVKEQLYRYL